jgi:hypothetical protein
MPSGGQNKLEACCHDSSRAFATAESEFVLFRVTPFPLLPLPPNHSSTNSTYFIRNAKALNLTISGKLRWFGLGMKETSCYDRRKNKDN